MPGTFRFGLFVLGTTVAPELVSVLDPPAVPGDVRKEFASFVAGQVTQQIPRQFAKLHLLRGGTPSAPQARRRRGRQRPKRALRLVYGCPLGGECHHATGLALQPERAPHAVALCVGAPVTRAARMRRVFRGSNRGGPRHPLEPAYEPWPRARMIGTGDVAQLVAY
jgi:hypothetical protein